MRRLRSVIYLILFAVYDNEAKEFSRCRLAVELDNRSLDEDQIKNFICLVDYNSYYTDWSCGPSKDGTKKLGIFQLNDRDLCKYGERGGVCYMDCNKFTDDDITDDLDCAKEVLRRHGYEHWEVWRKNCKLGPPDVRFCYTDTGNAEEPNLYTDNKSTLFNRVTSRPSGGHKVFDV